MEMDEIQASKLSQIAIRYLHEPNSRKRDKLFLQVCEHYMPYVKAKLRQIKECDRDEVIQIYRIEVLKALTLWNMRSNIETYMFNYVRSVLTKYLKTTRMFKNLKIKCVYIDDVLSDNGTIDISKYMEE